MNSDVIFVPVVGLSRSTTFGRALTSTRSRNAPSGDIARVTVVVCPPEIWISDRVRPAKPDREARTEQSRLGGRPGIWNAPEGAVTAPRPATPEPGQSTTM